MTPEELKNLTNDPVFSPGSMARTGDTMRNFGVRSVTINGCPAWELYRKRPVKNNRSTSIYYDAETLTITWERNKCAH